eukprot:TRINITY_DN19171_c0_g1_i11.p1 TRINITY_DN19171_c0_g1~~TRINITY_DN19171_c0_g1_i11.p1  ORF type:complete len:358 (-),score=26.30 TRINITY_DN19171_c0_g1_i11:1544-2617(-)
MGVWSTFRCVATWAGFFVPVMMEMYIHSRFGITKAVFELEEVCAGAVCSQEWQQFLTFAELVCRVCLAVGLARFFVDGWRAALHSELGAHCRSAFEHDGSLRLRVAVPASAASIFTAAVGLWGMLVSDKQLPMWAAIYSHFADVLCHSIIASALIGVTCDLGHAISKGETKKFLKNFFVCLDTVEAHSVASPRAEIETDTIVDDAFLHISEDHLQRHLLYRSVGRYCRRAVVWVVFLFTLTCYVIDSYTTCELPEWISSVLDILGCLCWVGIAWWLVTLVASLQKSCSRGADLGFPNAEDETSSTQPESSCLCSAVAGIAVSNIHAQDEDLEIPRQQCRDGSSVLQVEPLANQVVGS